MLGSSSPGGRELGAIGPCWARGANWGTERLPLRRGDYQYACPLARKVAVPSRAVGGAYRMGTGTSTSWVSSQESGGWCGSASRSNANVPPVGCFGNGYYLIRSSHHAGALRIGCAMKQSTRRCWLLLAAICLLGGGVGDRGLPVAVAQSSSDKPAAKTGLPAAVAEAVLDEVARRS